MMKQQVNTYIALAMVASVGIGATYLIVKFATQTDFSYIVTDESILIQAEVER